MDHLQILGCKATDKVTNFTGTVVSISYDLVGCIQAFVRPPMNKEGKLDDGHWFDASRLEIGERVMDSAFEHPLIKAAKEKGPSEKSAPQQ